MEKNEAVIEALLFSSSDPLSIADLKGITQQSKKSIQQAIEKLTDFYHKHERAFELVRIASGYQIRTKQEFSSWMKKNTRLKKKYLTKSALETLSVIIYKQPITKQQINHIRQVDSSGTIKSLLKKKMIRIVGRSEKMNRSLLYATSHQFLDTVGLKKISDMPNPNE